MTSERRLAIVVTLIGIAIRVSQVVFDRSLWTDEAMLALSIGTRGFAELTRPLLFEQIAPIGYLWGVKAVVLTLGMQEWALRLVSIVAGLLLLPLVWRLANRIAGPQVALGALTLTAFSPALVYFSNELKPYSLDPVVAVALLLVVWRTLERVDSDRRWLVAGAAGALGVWLSAPAIFILGGCALAFLVVVRRDRSIALLGRTCGVIAIWLISFGLAYATTYGSAARGHYMRAFWVESYLDATSVQGIVASWELIRRSVWGLLAGLIPYVRWWLGGYVTGEVVFHGLAIAAVALFAGGIRAMRRSGAVLQSWLLVGPVLATLAASLLQFYPFAPRLLIFLTPCLFVGIAAGVVEVARFLAARRVPVLVVLAAFGLAVLGFPPHLRWHYGQGQWADTRALVEEARAYDGPVYVLSRGVPLYLYYATDWHQPDTAGLRAVHDVIGPGRFGFENRPGPLSFSADEIAAITAVSDSSTVLGLPDGMEFAYLPGWSQFFPDESWASVEASRIDAAADSRIGLLALHNIALADRDIVEALNERGWVCDAATRSFGSYFASFSLRSHVGDSPPECPSWPANLRRRPSRDINRGSTR